MSEDQKEYKAQDKLPVEVRAQMLQKETSLYFNLAKFEHAQRIANLFSSSTMVPQHFQGNVANCLIALNYADRIQADPFLVMQNIYIVHGRPGIEAKLVIALINQSGKYAEPLKFKFDGSGDEYGCTAWTREAKSGEVVEGPKVTWKVVKSEGWDSKQGTKWKTIPDLMFRYRAASWFANVHCPELKLGMSTVEEIHDFVELAETKNGKWEPPAAPGQTAAEPVPPWSEAIQQMIDSAPEAFARFVAATIQANRTSEGELRMEANKDPDRFLAAYLSWFQKQQQQDTRRERKPRSDKGQPRKAQAAPDDSPMAGPPPPMDVPEPGQADQPAPERQQGEDEPPPLSDELLLDERRAELDELKRTHRYYVLEAMKRTGIAHPMTVDAYDELIRTVGLIEKEKNHSRS